MCESSSRLPPVEDFINLEVPRFWSTGTAQFRVPNDVWSCAALAGRCGTSKGRALISQTAVHTQIHIHMSIYSYEYMCIYKPWQASEWESCICFRFKNPLPEICKRALNQEPEPENPDPEPKPKSQTLSL